MTASAWRRVGGQPARSANLVSSRARQRSAAQRHSLTALALLTVTVAAVISVELKRRVPTVLDLSPHDGLLFTRRATSLVDDVWLGEFSNLTLAKGIGYPAFIAAAYEVGIPLMLAEQIVYLSAALSLSACVLVATGRRWLAAGCFVFLALDPVNYGAAGTYVLRDNLFASLGLLFVGSAALAALTVARSSRLVWVVLASLLCGAAGAAAWLTREEGLSLLPPIVVVVVGVVVSGWLARRRASGPGGASRWQYLRRAGRPVIAVGVAVAAFATPQAAVAMVNDDRYGVSLTNDMGAGSFLRAYADWSRVRVDREDAQVPINAVQRAAVYAVSPAAAALAPALENPENPWRFFACETTECDYRGGWMVWAIRDAAAAAGQFRTAETAQAYFSELSEQINAACEDGRITCRSRLPASLQPIQRTSAAELWASFLELSGALLSSRDLFETVQEMPEITQATRGEYIAVIHGLPGNQAAADARMAQFDEHRWPFQLLGAVYRVLTPVLLLVAFLAVAWPLIVGGRGIARRRDGAPLIVLAFALGLGVIGRLLLLSIIDVAQFDTAIPRYQLLNHTFLAALAAAGLAHGVSSWRDARQGGRGEQRQSDEDADSLPVARAAIGSSMGIAVADTGQAHRKAHHSQLGSSDDEDHAEYR